eukprot:7604931-Alexandrium_andersonii.AAC.1
MRSTDPSHCDLGGRGRFWGVVVQEEEDRDGGWQRSELLRKSLREQNISHLRGSPGEILGTGGAWTLLT